MADISILARILDGRVRQIDVSSNALVVGSLKIGASELTEAILAKLITIQGVADADGSYDSRYFTESELSATTGSTLIGDNNATYTNVSPAGATQRAFNDAVDAALGNISGDAADITYTPAVLTDWNGDADPGNVDGALDQLAERVDDNEIAIATKANDADVIKKDGSVAFTADQSMGGNKLTNVAAGTASGDAVNYAQLQAVESIIAQFEWYQLSAITYITDNTVAPPTEVTDDVYVLSHDGGSPNAAWDGASAGDIVKFNGTVWEATTPTTGMMISIDDETSSLRQWNGTSWAQKFFESTTASTGLEKVGFDIRMASSAAGAGLGFSAGVLSVNVDDTTIEIVTDTLQVKDAGIGEAKLATNAVTETKIADGAVSDAKVKSGSNLEEAVTFFGNTDISGAEAETLTDGSDASSLHSHSVDESVELAGEAFAATTTFAVRFAISGETAGRLYKADKDVSTNLVDDVVGFVQAPGAVTAGQNITLKRGGTLTLGASDTNFNAADIGKRVYLDATGAFTITPPTGTDISVKPIGKVKDVDKIFIHILDGYIDA